MISSKFLATISFLSFCLFGRGVRQDFPWTVSLTVSNVQGGEYEGEVELLAVFQDQTQHSIVLPSTKYLLGLKYDFDVRLTSAGPLQTAYIRTKGFCPLGLLPSDFLRLKQIDLISTSKNINYSKSVKDLAIKDACQNINVPGTAFDDFVESPVNPCIDSDGQKHEHNHRFEIGCSASCQCRNGSIECVDMCPPINWAPEQKCHSVHVPGQCCDRIVCDEDEQTKSCQESKPSKAVRRYPWSAMYCADAKCTQIHGGVLVGTKHLLTYATTLINPDLLVSFGNYIVDQGNLSDFTRLRIANVSTHPDFINGNSPVADSASRLQLVEFEKSFPLSKEIQSANLPFDKNQCVQLTKDECPFMTVGYDRTDETDPEIRQWFLHADKTQHGDQLCQQSNSTKSHPRMITPKRRGDKRTCLGGLVRDDCTGPWGGAVVSSIDVKAFPQANNESTSIDFVIGLLDPDTALVSCDNPGIASMLPLCKYADWINEIISSD